MAGLVWAPMFLLSAAQGTLSGGVTVPFFQSLSTHIRFLVAMPLLFLAEVVIDPRLRHFVEYAVDSGLVPPEERPAYDASLRAVARLRDSFPAELVLLLAALISVVAGLRVDLPEDISSWRAMATETGARLTPAGWWFAAVALPLFQFLLLRWAWRLVIWWVFLWRLSRENLHLVPTHPDLAGGLGTLGVVHSHFGMFAFAGSTALAGAYAENMFFAGATLDGLKLLAVGVAALNLLLFVGPLLFFSPRLLAVKRRGLREYGLLAGRYTRGFEAKWIEGKAPADEPLLGSADIQSLADLANSFEVVRNMRGVPFGRGLLIIIAASAVAPMAPLVLIVFPLQELVGQILKTLVGV
jgi:hypothetical protein